MSAAEERVARVRASLASTLLPLPGANTNNTAPTSSSSKKDESATGSGDFVAFEDTKKTTTNSTSSAKLPTGGIASMIAAYGKAKSATEEVEELGARDYLVSISVVIHFMLFEMYFLCAFVNTLYQIYNERTRHLLSHQPPYVITFTILFYLAEAQSIESAERWQWAARNRIEQNIFEEHHSKCGEP